MFVKICGTTSEDDALLAVAMGADAIGFVFAPSPRQVAPGVVADIVKRLPPEILTVGVFRDAAPEQVVDTINRTRLKAAQLHGAETPAMTEWIRERVPMVIKAFVAGSRLSEVAHQHRADAILIDSPAPGTGQVFDWKLAEGAPDGAKLIVAGGLTSDNVADAIAAVHPWGVDVVTGVESQPGRKDPRKLRAFIAAAKAADEGKPYESPPGGPVAYDWQDDS